MTVWDESFVKLTFILAILANRVWLCFRLSFVVRCGMVGAANRHNHQCSGTEQDLSLPAEGTDSAGDRRKRKYLPTTQSNDTQQYAPKFQYVHPESADEVTALCLPNGSLLHRALSPHSDTSRSTRTSSRSPRYCTCTTPMTNSRSSSPSKTIT